MMIRKMQRKVLREFNIKTLQRIYDRKSNITFYNRVCDLINEKLKKWKAAYQEFLNEITEKTGLTENDYKDDIEKMKDRIKPYQKYFTDIFDIMVDTEINRNSETEKQVRQWRKTNNDRLKEIADSIDNHYPPPEKSLIYYILFYIVLKTGGGNADSNNI